VAGIDIINLLPLIANTRMGVICSKPGTVQGGHTVVGTTRTLGGDGRGGKDSIPVNPRQAALEAAERRKQTVCPLLVTMDLRS